MAAFVFNRTSKLPDCTYDYKVFYLANNVSKQNLNPHAFSS